MDLHAAGVGNGRAVGGVREGGRADRNQDHRERVPSVPEALRNAEERRTVGKAVTRLASSVYVRQIVKAGA